MIYYCSHPDNKGEVNPCESAHLPLEHPLCEYLRVGQIISIGEGEVQ
jgi:hypothetical protein